MENDELKKMLQEQEERLFKQFEEREKNLIKYFEEREAKLIASIKENIVEESQLLKVDIVGSVKSEDKKENYLTEIENTDILSNRLLDSVELSMEDFNRLGGLSEQQVKEYSERQSKKVEQEKPQEQKTNHQVNKNVFDMRNKFVNKTNEVKPLVMDKPKEEKPIKSFDINAVEKPKEAITIDMRNEASEASNFFQANFKPTTKERMPEIVKYANIVRSHEKLSMETLDKEMKQDGYKQFGVNGDNKVLVNYFDKVNTFEYGGKNGEAFRNDAKKMHNMTKWLDGFQPGRQAMNTAHEQENRVARMSNDPDVSKTFELKHKVENKYFDIQERLELSKAKQHFPNELNYPEVKPVTRRDMEELHNMFRDYAAHKLGKEWRHTYADATKDPFNDEYINKKAERKNQLNTNAKEEFKKNRGLKQ